MALECSLILRSSRRRHGATAGRKPDDPVEFAVPMGGGLILSPDAFIYTNRKLIIELASRYQLPAIFGIPSTAADGGLIFYCVDIVESYRQRRSTLTVSSAAKSGPHYLCSNRPNSR
jgi:hypothetical protein